MISRRHFTRGALATIPVALIDPQSLFASTARCIPTEAMELGPYHREGTPWRTALARPEEKGRPLTVRGRVLGDDRCTSLSDVLIDVWHADTAGHYDFQDDPPPATPASYRLRGVMLSGENGLYEYSTIVPGNYGRRTKHIHYLVQRTGYEPLITQMYFEGDPRNTTDPLVRKSLIIPLQTRRDGGGLMTFDIVLRRERPLDAALLRSFDDFVGTYRDAANNETKIEWRNGQLVARWMDEVAHLRPRSASRFFAEEWAATLTFVRDEHGAVAELLGDSDDGVHYRMKRR